MRFSLLAVIAIAIVIGLAVVFLVKALGLLAPARVESPVVTPAPPPVISVLVPTRNLFVTDTLNPGDVTVRPLRPSEVDDYKAHTSDYLNPVPSIAYFRYMARDITADQPIKRSDLVEPKKPDPLNLRLIPSARAVNVLVLKDSSVGGLIQVGDWVDVHVLTDVNRSDSPTRQILGGLLVRNAQVIAKRDTLYSIYSPLQPGPISFALSTNPYRAALIEYARTVGSLSLVPVSADEKEKLDALKKDADRDPSKVNQILMGDPASPEYPLEADRLRRYAMGPSGVGGDDLARVLALQPIAPPHTVQYISGVTQKGLLSFGDPIAPPRYQFTPARNPDGTTNATRGPTAPVSPPVNPLRQ